MGRLILANGAHAKDQIHAITSWVPCMFGSQGTNTYIQSVLGARDSKYVNANKHCVVARFNLCLQRTILSTYIYLLLLIYAVGGPDHMCIRGSHEQAQLLMC